jgi:ATPase subunit of ABC transporter with duplicated ATPase domains
MPESPLLEVRELTAFYGDFQALFGVSLSVAGGRATALVGANGAGKTTLLRILGGLLSSDTGEVRPGHGLRMGYYAQEHETLDVDRTILEHMRSAAAEQTDTELRKILGAFLFSGDDVDKPAGVLSGGEKTRLALATLVCSGANVLLLDEPTNNLDPISREQVLDAIANYPGAIVLVTHDAGAVQALKPDRAILLPDGDEDAWSDDLLELVELA